MKNNPIKEAIVLAGGFGTRLSQVVRDVPKPLAPVYTRPFLTFLLDKLSDAGITRVILSVGYLWQQIQTYFGDSYREMEIRYSVEDTPLGTGGAVRKAMEQVKGAAVWVLNGDTFFDVDLQALTALAARHPESPLVFALRCVQDVSRYGEVRLGPDGRVLSFAEKAGGARPGAINGGMYLIRTEWMRGLSLPEKFSFENDVLAVAWRETPVYAQAFDPFFIDIGVPEDYNKARWQLPLYTSEYLFLDRDGVINRKIDGGYVTRPGEFEFLPGVLDSMAYLAGRFKRIFIVSNQQGIGKGLFTFGDLESVHEAMLSAIRLCGGRIDHIYVCPDLATVGSHNRKPAPGMAFQAKTDYPEVDFTRSLMVGDALSDVEFAHNAGIFPVYLDGKVHSESQVMMYNPLCCKNLADFVSVLKSLEIR
ncbi:MAG: HAD-IIIA family hydrolase [Paludibacteraceae bacterium]|nr:HAD-IIIA family hydrolase [Paludibacteraceae bacterium]